MKKDYRLLQGFALVEEVKEEKKINGVIIPDSVSEEEIIFGKVLARGDEFFKEGLAVKPLFEKGDTVLFGRHSIVLKFKDDGKEYLIVEISDIYAVVE